MTDQELLNLAILALRAQAILSDMQREATACWQIKPDDPRYTPFIGPWSGYTAPEIRFADFAHARKMLRTKFLDLTKDMEVKPCEL